MLKIEKVSKLEEYIFVEDVQNENLNNLIANQSAGILKETRAKEIKESYDQNRSKKLYVVYNDEEMIGFLSWEKDYKFLKSNKKDTAFIFVGFKEKYLKTAILETTFKMFENLLNEISFKYIEAGIFDFDKKGERCYNKMGFEKVARVDKSTYYDGKWHNEYRYLKALVKERL